MRRYAAFGTTFLLMGLFWGRIAVSPVSQSGFISLTAGISAIGHFCLGGGILSGAIEPNSVPDEEMSPLTSYVFAVLSVVGATGVLIVSILRYF